jgi:hypothetical protein
MKMLLASLCLSIALVASCGGGSGGGTCANAPACGGNIVGTWKITSSCVTIAIGSMDLMGCPGETASLSGAAITGTVTYRADMTYTSADTITGTVIDDVPAACLASQGTTLSCAQLTQLLQSSGMAGQCANAAGGGCRCTLPLDTTNPPTNGTYATTAAGVLTETDQGSTTADMSDYCVSGTTLTESPRPGSGMMGQGSSFSGTITLAKQ